MHLPLCLASLIASAWFTQPVLPNRPATIVDLQGFRKDIQAKSIQSGKIQSLLTAPRKEAREPDKEQDLLTAVTEHDMMVEAGWLTAWGMLFAGGALAWGVSHYVRQQQWQRLEFLRQAVKSLSRI